MPFASYSTGTVSVPANGTTVTGVGSIWSGVNARPGDMLQIGAVLSFISDVTDPTHLVIPPYAGTTVSAVAYTIYQTSPLRFVGGQAMTDVSSLVALLNGMGTIYAVPGAAPDPSIGSDGQYALKTNTGIWRLWLKTGGVWVDQGSPVGTNYRGAWNSATAYAANDVTTRLGSAYISKGTNTNAPPESSPTSWDVLAAKGDTGNTGATGATGTAATIAVNSVSTLPAGSSATVTNLGTSSAASFAFGIPQGPQGIQGTQGLQGVGLQPDASGTITQRATYDGQTTGYKFLETDVSPFRLYIKASNTTGDWAGPTFIGGNFPVGDLGHITDSIVQTFDFGHIV
ncbi:hypothetical protein SAMN05444159_1251 [Bradyrhizobium lablabi]|uniref:Uncharacterized protein n=1 Tax=Bradyrhizobium lablabi TaxID=722472 RepID=A0A1M6LE46_9BRAD|nr:hypothetical protein [Bradyrhizobium lablabi]SHJ69437.1 hypothetical protein SAMN05444159_1251 [Bradyrhizobium lablabi]